MTAGTGILGTGGGVADGAPIDVGVGARSAFVTARPTGPIFVKGASPVMYAALPKTSCILLSPPDLPCSGFPVKGSRASVNLFSAATDRTIQRSSTFFALE